MTSNPTLTPEYLAEDCGASLFGVSVAFAVLSTVFVLFFLVARRLKESLQSADVYFTILAYVFTLVLALLGIVKVKLAGAGQHTIAVELEDPSKIVLWLKFELAAQFIYIYAVTFPKLALIHLYLRVFTKSIYRQITYVAAAIVVINVVTSTLIDFAICTPFEYNWNKSLPGGHCGNLYLLFKLASIPNIITDFVLLILPIPMVWNLNTKTVQKIGITLTFLTGSFGMITAIIRLYQFSTTDLYSDMTFNSVTTMTWTIIEPGCYLIAAILPSLRPLLKHISEFRAYSYVQNRFSNATTRQTGQPAEVLVFYHRRKSSDMSGDF